VFLFSSSSFIEGSKKRKSHDKNAKTKDDICPFADGLSVTFKHEVDKLPDNSACLSPSTGKLAILGLSNLKDKIAEKAINTLMTIIISGFSLGQAKPDEVGSLLEKHKKELQTLDIKEYLCKNFSEFSRGYVWNSIYMSQNNVKQGALEIVSHLGSGNGLQNFYDSIKCDNPMKHFSKKKRRFR